MQRRQRHRLELARAGRASSASWLTCPAGPRIADAHQSERDAAPTLAGEREPDRLVLLGRELELAAARRATCLQYSRAVSRWAIEESTTPLWSASSSAIDVDWWPDISP